MNTRITEGINMPVNKLRIMHKIGEKEGEREREREREREEEKEKRESVKIYI